MFLLKNSSAGKILVAKLFFVMKDSVILWWWTIKIYKNDAINFLKSLPNDSIDLIVTDPAYSWMNQMLKLWKWKIIWKYSEKWEEWWKRFAEFEDSEENYTIFLKECRRVLKNNRHIYIMFDSYSLLSLAPVVRNIFDVKNIICWDKAHIWLWHYFRRKHEFILFASKGKRNLNSKSIPDIWKVKRISRSDYPTQKPTEIFKIMIKWSWELWYTVCDPFLWSGSSMIASIKNWCNFIWCDISEKSIEISTKRAEEFLNRWVDILQNYSALSDDALTNKIFA